MMRKLLSLCFVTVIAVATSFGVMAGGHTTAKKDKDGKWVSPGEGNASGDVILVVGATGKSGVLIVNQLVGLGQEVRALVRSEQKGKDRLPPQVKLFVGDVTKPNTLPAAFDGANVLITTIGAGGAKWDPVNNPETVDFKGTVALVEAAQKAGVKHIVQVSSMGVTQPDHFLNKMMNNMLNWKIKGENAIRSSGIAYTIIRPGGLATAPAGRKQIQFIQGDPKGLIGFISRSDVARVVVNSLQDANSHNKTVEIIWDQKSTSGQINWADVWTGLKTD